jgi:RHS repeat-associated protein
VQYAYANGAAGHVRPTSVTYPNGRMLNFSYGDSGAVSDVIHRVAALVDHDGSTHLADYAYLGLGVIVKTDYSQPNVSQNLAFGTGSDPYDGLDRFGRTVDHLWRNNANSTDLVRIRHGYDRAGNRLWRQDAVSAAQSPAVYMDELYSDDGVNQLTAMQRGQLNAAKTGIASGTKSFGEGWSLDMMGNWRTFRRDTNGDGVCELDQSRTHNPMNEISMVTIGQQPTMYGHDRAGNMTSLPKPSDWNSSYNLTWDAWNRLVRVSERIMAASQTVAEYRYDGRNFRIVKKTYAGGTLAEIRHYFYNSDWQCLEDRLTVVSSGVLSSYADRQYVWGLRYIDDLILRDRNSDGNPAADGSYSSGSSSGSSSGVTGNLGFTGSGLDERLYCHQDPNWNVVALTNSSGAIVERYGYSAYGKAAILTPAFAARATSGYAWDSLYTGRQLDAETGLYHYRNRYYAAEMGRFVSRDPIGYDGGMNLHEYAGDSPISGAVCSGVVMQLRPMAKASTIECKGGKLVIVNNETDCDKKCTQIHEQVHFDDWKKRYGDDLCKGVKDGDLPTGGKDYKEFLRKSECSAYAAGKKCREDMLNESCNKKNGLSDSQKREVQRGIDRDNKQLKDKKCKSK